LKQYILYHWLIFTLQRTTWAALCKANFITSSWTFHNNHVDKVFRASALQSVGMCSIPSLSQTKVRF